jgi:predicted FMN-binding regulatory protein PaiB
MKKLCCLTAAALIALVGCTFEEPNPGATYQPPTKEKMEARIKELEADPKLSQEAKNAAIAGVRRAMEEAERAEAQSAELAQKQKQAGQ